MKFAEAHKHYAIAAKLLEEEMNDKGASRAQEEQIIKVGPTVPCFTFC